MEPIDIFEIKTKLFAIGC